MPISARLIVNPAALKLKRDRVQPLLDALRRPVGAEEGRMNATRLSCAASTPQRRVSTRELAALIAFEAAQDPRSTRPWRGSSPT